MFCALTRAPPPSCSAGPRAAHRWRHAGVREGHRPAQPQLQGLRGLDDIGQRWSRRVSTVRVEGRLRQAGVGPRTSASCSCRTPAGPR
jgi:hypothetical protein